MNEINIDLILNDFEINFEEKIITFCKYIYNSFDFNNVAFLAIEFCDSEQIVEINSQYRNKNTDTDVLSFEYYDNLAQNIDKYDGQILNLGDILISVEYAKNQAKDLGNSFEQEVLFLICHGFLHLLGYDHLEKEDEQLMIAKQKQLFKEFNKTYA